MNFRRLSARWNLFVARITWTHITRMVGLTALIYEILVENADRPSLMVVIGSMILGAEAFSRDRKHYKRRRSEEDLDSDE